MGISVTTRERRSVSSNRKGQMQNSPSQGEEEDMVALSNLGKINLNPVCGSMDACLFLELDPSKKKCVNKGSNFCPLGIEELAKNVHAYRLRQASRLKSHQLLA